MTFDPSLGRARANSVAIEIIKMAADIEAVEHLPDYPGSVTVKRLKGTLVAKRSKKSVPDHLVDTSKTLKSPVLHEIILQTYALRAQKSILR